jgi:hypothetical protein
MAQPVSDLGRRARWRFAAQAFAGDQADRSRERTSSAFALNDRIAATRASAR